jgi:hypothetical protein
MEKEDYIKCIVSILNFLVLSDDEFKELNRNTFDLETTKKMYTPVLNL